MRIELLDTVNSTNEYIKRYLPAGENAIVCARCQTDGRGTKGRRFLSDAGGVYLSALTFYDELPAGQAFRVMMHAAVAACRTAEAFGVKAQIKWPNDIFAHDRKLAGILIENVVADGCIRASIAGIGINAENDVSALDGTAISLSEAAGRRIAADRARDALIENLMRTYVALADDYAARSCVPGHTVTVEENGKTYAAFARRVLGDGRLEIEEGGRMRTLSAAEIRICM